MKKEKTIDMVHGPLLKNIILFAIPLMLTNLLQMLFNAADTIVVGKFAGQEALAAVGATGSLIFLLTSIFNGLSMGANVVIAKSIGSRSHEKIVKAVHTSIFISIMGGILLTVLGLFFSKILLGWMATPADIINLSELYMRIYFIGSIPMLVYNFGAAILRSKGDTKRPLYFLIVSGVLNAVLNLFFVIVLKMSVAGVATATVISQTVAAILTIRTLMKAQDETHLDLKAIKMDLQIAMDIMKIGVPAGIQGLVFSLSNVVIQSSINSFNSSVIVAGNSAAGNIENFVYIGMMAFTQATVTFTSQNVGARNYPAIKKVLAQTMILTTVSAFLVGLLTYVFGDTILQFYTNEPEVIRVGLIRLKYVALLLFLNGSLDVFVNSMRGMGYSSVPTLVMIAGICGFRLVWLWTIFPMHRTLEVIYLCFPISWIITTLIQGGLWVYCHHHFISQEAQYS